MGPARLSPHIRRRLFIVGTALVCSVAFAFTFQAVGRIVNNTERNDAQDVRDRRIAANTRRIAQALTTLKAERAKRIAATRRVTKNLCEAVEPSAAAYRLVLQFPDDGDEDHVSKELERAFEAELERGIAAIERLDCKNIP